MNIRRLLYFSAITALGYVLLSWFGILTAVLVFFFVNALYSITFFKKEVALFLRSARSLTLSKKQKILLTVKCMCAKCYPYLDDYSLGRLLSRMKLNDFIFSSIDIVYLGSIEADYNRLFKAFSEEESRFIFICFLGLASHINRDQARSFLRALGDALPEYTAGLILQENDFESCLPCFQVLDVEPGSKLELIKKQYKKLALDFHPDTLEALSDRQKQLSREAFLKIKDAYNKLVKLYSSDNS